MSLAPLLLHNKCSRHLVTKSIMIIPAAKLHEAATSARLPVLLLGQTSGNPSAAQEEAWAGHDVRGRAAARTDAPNWGRSCTGAAAATTAQGEAGWGPLAPPSKAPATGLAGEALQHNLMSC